MTSRPTRRAVLRAGLALPLLAACTDDAPAGPAPPPDPDVALHDAAVVREKALLEAYDGALLAVPALAPRLRPLRAEHAEHLAALRAADPEPDPSPSGSPSPSARAAAPPPGDPATVLAALAALELTTATDHGTSAMAASRELATLLATLAASEASHRVALA